MSRLTISTDCPTCAGPLDFTEGTNSLRCSHCRTRLLVTGRRRLLSYVIPPSVTASEAVSLGLNAHRELGRVDAQPAEEPRLIYIPYYRMTSQIFSWQKQPSIPQVSVGSILDSADEPGFTADVETPVVRFGGWLARGIEMLVDSLSDAPPTRDRVSLDRTAAMAVITSRTEQATRNRGRVSLEFRHRFIEKNFVACDLQIAELYSVGVRPTVLKLHLLNLDNPDGFIVSATVPVEVASERGLMYEGGDALSSVAVGSTLSLVHMPVWMIPFHSGGERMVALVDALTPLIVRLNAETATIAVLQQSSTGKPVVAGFRPLVCPNCGWDVEARDDDAVLFCASCRRAWQILGSSLEPIASEQVRPAGMSLAQAVEWLPFWRVRSSKKAESRGQKVEGTDHIENESEQLFVIPAFRYRHLKTLADLAVLLSGAAITLERVPPGDEPLAGCYYDVADAKRLAHFAQIALRKGTSEVETEEVLSVQDLVWLPLVVRGSSLVETITGCSIAKNLLLN